MLLNPHKKDKKTSIEPKQTQDKSRKELRKMDRRKEVNLTKPSHHREGQNDKNDQLNSYV